MFASPARFLLLIVRLPGHVGRHLRQRHPAGVTVPRHHSGPHVGHGQAVVGRSFSVVLVCAGSAAPAAAPASLVAAATAAAAAL